MKHLKLFKTNAAYEAAKPSIPNSDTPCIAAIEEGGGVNYIAKTIYESDLSIGPWVDLGLPSGTMWASYNLGATSPCEYGDYYQWGSITPTTVPFNWEKTPFNNGSSSYDASHFNSVMDTICPNGVLAPEYDAIYQSTGGKAKIPSKADFEELINNTTHEFVLCSKGLGHEHENPVYGRLFTGKNGGKIFIPAAGYGYDSSMYSVGSYGYAWSSSLNTSNHIYAWSINFSGWYCRMGSESRCQGRSVRGVRSICLKKY